MMLALWPTKVKLSKTRKVRPERVYVFSIIRTKTLRDPPLTY